jgi:hypothetical protein
MTYRQSFLASNLARPIIIALLIRLLIMPLFYHPDIKTQNFHLQFMPKGIFNIYQYTKQNQNILPYTDTYNYLPLSYFFLGSIHTLLQPLLPPDYLSWLNNWGTGQNDYPNLFLYLLVLKLPYLFFDLAISLIIYRLTSSRFTSLLWLFNPVSLYSVYILANFDVIPVFFTILSLYFLTKNRNHWSALSLGIAIALKAYPVMFLPFFIFHKNLKTKNRLVYLFLSLLPLILSTLPFLSSPYFLNSFSGSGLTQKVLEYRLFNLPLFPCAYLLILLSYLRHPPHNFYSHLSFTSLAFFSLVNFHPQWLLWFLPFQLLFMLKQPLLRLPFLVFSFLAFSYIFLINDNFLFWGHLTPIDSEFIELTSPYRLILLRTPINPDTLRQFAHTLIGLTGLFSYFFYEKISSHRR